MMQKQIKRFEWAGDKWTDNLMNNIFLFNYIIYLHLFSYWFYNKYVRWKYNKVSTMSR